MTEQSRPITDPMDAVLAEVRRRLAAGREGNFIAELGGGDLGYRLWWGRITAVVPGSPPDERYAVDEVRPSAVDGGGALVWELVPDGGRNVVVWNVAEAIDRTHELPEGEVVLVREELDQSHPGEFRAVFFRAASPGEPPSVGGSRMCRIISYGGGSAYTVQPVAWSGGAWVDDGDTLSGVVNVGELQAGEDGYLAGPSGADVYVRLYTEGDDAFLVVHPPRMP